MATLTPMMEQYIEIKNQYKDCIVFYRLGDFYEMFYEDAMIGSKELEITLTGKSCGEGERAPMCGVPYHSVDGYLTKLVNKGYKVALCEQVEDPKAGKGIVKREVIRIVTPGTNLNTQTLDETKNNYLISICYTPQEYGISAIDVTTGDYYVTEVDSKRKLLDEINKYSPSELICNDNFLISGVDIEYLKQKLQIAVSVLEPWYYDEALCIKSLKEHFLVPSLAQLSLQNYSIGLIAAGGAIQYLYETQKNALSHLTTITPYITNKYMALDSSTRRNLEIVETLREKQKRGSLLWVLDKTKTAMGARLLRNYMEQPLIEKELIEARLDAISVLNEHIIVRDEIREYLHCIYDLERFISKVSYKTANPRDFTAFAVSLSMLPHIKVLLKELDTELLHSLYENLYTLEDLCQLIHCAIIDEPPIAIKEGGIIKEGYNKEVDTLRTAKKDGKKWVTDLEVREKENTGIRNLKIKYNKIFGYYLEVTNSYQNLVPETWIRKQTMSNAERYITPELKELEEIILGAEDKLYALEYQLFNELRDKIAEKIVNIQITAKTIAKIDVFASLAVVAERNQYVRPIINETGKICIKDGRHPVVEQMLSNHLFVSNDTLLDNEKNRISIITGPNMAGKSTYMRQTALITLMAQIGSFVPASKAEIGIVDRIFTRVGASDDLSSGQSTFMVEMTEVANILKNATKNSLLVLDEIGRGTSTFDGLSIAWAVIEYISNPRILGAKTLFATHYHELTELEGNINSVNNYCIAVKEQGEDIVFLRKIVKGGADKSYGIQVAKLAGVPDAVLKRAREIVTQLSEHDIAVQAKKIAIKDTQLSLFDYSFEKQEESLSSTSNVRKKLELDIGKGLDKKQHSKIEEELGALNISNMTPIEALNKLYELQAKLKES